VVAREKKAFSCFDRRQYRQTMFRSQIETSSDEWRHISDASAAYPKQDATCATPLLASAAQPVAHNRAAHPAFRIPAAAERARGGLL